MKKIIRIILLLALIILALTIYFRPTKFPIFDSFNYRLGDMVLHKQGHIYLLKKIYNYYYPDSIANEYLKRVNYDKIPDYDLLHDIVKEKSQDLEKPSKKSLVIHLRVGDVIEWEYKGDIDELLEGKSDYTGSDGHLYLFDYEYFDNNLQKVKDKIEKIIIVGGYHIKRNTTRSEIYINKICDFFEKKGFEVEKRINQYTPDEDFLFMCNSSYYLKTGGGYSNLISQMVTKNNNINLI